MATTLNTLKAGDAGTITALSGDGQISQRLAEMGMVVGARYEVVRFAPLGDPIEVMLDGYHLSLRKAEAALVQVEVCPNAA